MDKTHSTYYTLQYELSDRIHRKGDCEAASKDIVYIGQQESCKIKYENSTPYSDEIFAIVKPSNIDNEWQLIPASQYIKTFVNGNNITLVHYLKDGDRISFENENQELLFHIHHDDKYDESMGVKYIPTSISRKLIALMILIPCVLFLILGGFIYQINKDGQKKYILLNHIKPSILQLSVDSVFYVMVTHSGEQILQSYSYINQEGHAISGSAFITDDHRIITARHCIEPWLNDNDILTMDSIANIKSIPTRWALEAETYNQLHNNDTIYKVITICNLYRGAKGTEQFATACKSSDFIYNSSRDDIIEKGDFFHEYYWRSIVDTYSKKDMMLDDIAWMHTDSVGLIKVANKEDLTNMLKERASLDFMGYPDYKTSGFEITDGKVQQQFRTGEMIIHNGKLLHGYSGGPVLVVKGNDIYSVGVISRIDNRGGERIYSVPITELLQ